VIEHRDMQRLREFAADSIAFLLDHVCVQDLQAGNADTHRYFRSAGRKRSYPEAGGGDVFQAHFHPGAASLPDFA